MCQANWRLEACSPLTPSIVQFYPGLFQIVVLTFHSQQRDLDPEKLVGSSQVYSASDTQHWNCLDWVIKQNAEIGIFVLCSVMARKIPNFVLALAPYLRAGARNFSALSLFPTFLPPFSHLFSTFLSPFSHLCPTSVPRISYRYAIFVLYIRYLSVTKDPELIHAVPE